MEDALSSECKVKQIWRFSGISQQTSASHVLGAGCSCLGVEKMLRWPSSWGSGERTICPLRERSPKLA